MLKEYFSLTISSQGYLYSLPLMLPNYIPNLSYIPSFLFDLARNVNWKEEELCFDTICHVLASFYSIHSNDLNMNSSNDSNSSSISNFRQSSYSHQHVVQHIIFSAFRSYLLPTIRHESDGTIIQVISLPDLYKVFERC
jgi:DNA mismatch repair protein MLH1